MSTQVSLRNLDSASWRLVQDILDRFERAHQSAGSKLDAVDLHRFMPPPDDPLLSVVLQELVKTHLEFCWRHNQGITLEKILTKLPELGKAQTLPVGLIYEEYRVRQLHGDSPTISTYQARFPDQYPELELMIREQPLPTQTETSKTPVRPAASAPAPAGQLLAGGGFKKIKRIGSGGFGEVWRAEAPGGIEVAIKIVFRPIEDDAAQRELQSLELIKLLRHPFLLQTQQFQIIDSKLHIVMELADGSLRDRLRQCRSEDKHGIPVSELLSYFREAAEALDFLHQKKIFHRDIKPDNILLLQNHAKLADFGLARFHEGDQSVSASGSGTPGYMAPEVWAGKISDSSDQYSLAMTYVELRLDRPPVHNMMQLMVEHLEKKPDLDPLPKAEQKVLLQALAKDPAQRFPTCKELVRALEKALSKELRRTDPDLIMPEIDSGVSAPPSPPTDEDGAAAISAAPTTSFRPDTALHWQPTSAKPGRTTPTTQKTKSSSEKTKPSWKPAEKKRSNKTLGVIVILVTFAAAVLVGMILITSRATDRSRDPSKTTATDNNADIDKTELKQKNDFAGKDKNQKDEKQSVAGNTNGKDRDPNETVREQILKSLAGLESANTFKAFLPTCERRTSQPDNDGLILACQAECLLEGDGDAKLPEANAKVQEAFRRPDPCNYARYVRALVKWKTQKLAEAAEDLVAAFSRSADGIAWQNQFRKNRALHIWLDAINEQRLREGIHKKYFKDASVVYPWVRQAYELNSSMPELVAFLALTLAEKEPPDIAHAVEYIAPLRQRPGLDKLPDREAAYALLLVDAGLYSSRPGEANIKKAIESYCEVLKLIQSDPDFKKNAGSDAAKEIREAVFQPALKAASTIEERSHLIQKFPERMEAAENQHFLDELLAELGSIVIKKEVLESSGPKDFQVLLQDCKKLSQAPKVDPLVQACLAECLLRGKGNPQPNTGASNALTKVDGGSASLPYVQFVRGLDYLTNSKWLEAVQAFDQAFVHDDAEWLPWQEETRRRLATKAYYEAAKAIFKTKGPDEAKKAVEYFRNARKLSDLTPLNELLVFADAAFVADRIPEFAKLMDELLKDKGFARAPSQELGRIGQHFAEWADAPGNKSHAENILDKIFPALQAALPSDEKAVNKPDALNFWLGKYYWKQEDKKEALKFFASSLIKSPVAHLGGDPRFDDVKNEMRGFANKEYWQQIFQAAVGEDPKNRTERQWELIVRRFEFISANDVLLKENLRQKPPGLIQDANDLVEFNKGKHADLECDGHMIALSAIDRGIRMKVGDDEEMRKAEKNHWKELGTLLTQDRIYDNWRFSKLWADGFVDRYGGESSDKEMKEIADKLKKKRENKSRAKPGEGELNKIKRPTKVYATLNWIPLKFTLS